MVLKQKLRRTDSKSLDYLENSEYKFCFVEFPECLFNCFLILEIHKNEARQRVSILGHKDYSINRILELVLSKFWS